MAQMVTFWPGTWAIWTVMQGRISSIMRAWQRTGCMSWCWSWMYRQWQGYRYWGFWYWWQWWSRCWYDRERSMRLICQRLFAYNSIETIMRIGCIIDGTFSAIRIHYGITSLNYITVTSFMLTLRIAGITILYVIAETVFRDWIVWFGGSRFGN